MTRTATRDRRRNSAASATTPEGAPAAVARGEASPSAAASHTPLDSPAPWLRYAIDAAQRWALLLQALVERGDALLADERAGLPMRLKFPYETVLDASTFAEPAGYLLLRILPDGDACFERCAGAQRRPVIVFDPRAGHGPGIGGLKRDSEVGMAMRRGHPVYFVAHHMQPSPGQTLARVHHALRRFVAEVVRRHPGERPALYGNCQAGWAVALLAADCSGVTGPTVLNGAPLSYWGGDSGVNPMRLAGGLTGGVWATRLLADLSNGLFDGAWLAYNFEQLDPGHAFFGKYRALLSRPEAERERFIEFERWWGEYCFLTREEIVAIVENLFIGNRLEEGGFRICECCHADLQRLSSPLLVFASDGDNITPPQQALGWVRAVWPTTKALIAAGQRICYLLNPSVGHLGIFVSADVAKREHRAILAGLDDLEALEPGFYEMRILASTGESDCLEPQYEVRFEPRRVEDIAAPKHADAFVRVRALSEAADAWYQSTVGPVAQTIGTQALAELLKWSHPMRASRFAWAHAFNPFAVAIDTAATWAKTTRAPLIADDPWVKVESLAMDFWGATFEEWRRRRDAVAEAVFAGLYNGGEDAVSPGPVAHVESAAPSASDTMSCP